MVATSALYAYLLVINLRLDVRKDYYHAELNIFRTFTQATPGD